MKVFRLVAVLGAGAVLLAGCGDSGESVDHKAPSITSTSPHSEQRGETEEVSPHPAYLEMTTDWFLDGDHSGLALANKADIFKRANVALSIDRPIIPSRPVHYVNDKAVSLAIMAEPEVLLARARGVPIVAIAKLLKTPVSAIIWLPKSGIATVRGLAGKTVGTAGLPYEKDLVTTILSLAGVRSDQAEVRGFGYYEAQALAKGRADAVIANPVVVVPELRALGLKPVVHPVSQLGVPPYDQLAVVAREDTLQKKGRAIRRFLAALPRGTRLAKRDPQAATKAVVEQTELRPKVAAAGVAQALPKLAESNRMDPAQWRHFEAWMKVHHLLEESATASGGFTNAYLPIASH
jgi:putative hydroxymethylpyrimidine transport system substrate-binding protein